MEGSESGVEDGSVQINYESGCGSGRPKNIRYRSGSGTLLKRIRNDGLTHLALFQIPNHRRYLVDSGHRRARTKQQGRRTAEKRASSPLRVAAAALTPSHLKRGCHSPAAKGPAAAAAGPPRRRECGCRSAWETAAGQGWAGFERAPHRSG
jgi:hypothetical protein